MRPLDIAVILLYLVGVVWAGLASRGKKEDSDEFFTSKGGFTGRLGMIMVGFSMAATLFSGVSYVIYTSVGFSAGAGIVMGMLAWRSSTVQAGVTAAALNVIMNSWSVSRAAIPMTFDCGNLRISALISSVHRYL